MSTRPSVAAELDTVVRLRASVTRLARLLRQQDQTGYGPTAIAVLATVGYEGPLTLGELATREQVAPPTITKVVDKLEANGLVTRSADADDRRVRRVEITPAGLAQLDEARMRRTTWLAERLAALDPDDLDRLRAAVDVLEQLTAATGWPPPEVQT